MNRLMNRRTTDRKKVPLRTRLFDIAAAMPSALGGLSILVLFINFVFWWPLLPAFQIDKPESHNAHYENGVLRVHRAHCVDELDMPVTLTHDLVLISEHGEPELRITLPQTVQVYKTGCLSVDRLFEIPSFIPSGDYHLVSTATWQANPFRVAVARLPELPVTIPPRKLEKEIHQ